LLRKFECDGWDERRKKEKKGRGRATEEKRLPPNVRIFSFYWSGRG
jgi:hypothetical protein